jgi:hypothetical protein
MDPSDVDFGDNVFQHEEHLEVSLETELQSPRSWPGLGSPRLLPRSMDCSSVESIRRITMSTSSSTALATFCPVAALVSMYAKLTKN